jgi:hypothetical protein
MLVKRLVAGLALTLAIGGPAHAEGVALAFRILEPARWLSNEWLVVRYELENVTSAPAYIAQHPGVSMIVACTTDQGITGGVPGGAWSSDGQLARKYFIRLEPGEALMGEKTVEVPVECRSGIKVLGVYQSELGDAWGLAVPGQRFYATPIPVTRAKGGVR